MSRQPRTHLVGTLVLADLHTHEGGSTCRHADGQMRATVSGGTCSAHASTARASCTLAAIAIALKCFAATMAHGPGPQHPPWESCATPRSRVMVGKRSALCQWPLKPPVLPHVAGRRPWPPPTVTACRALAHLLSEDEHLVVMGQLLVQRRVEGVADRQLQGATIIQQQAHTGSGGVTSSAPVDGPP